MWDTYGKKWRCGTLMGRSGDVGRLWGEVEIWDAYGEEEMWDTDGEKWVVVRVPVFLLHANTYIPSSPQANHEECSKHSKYEVMYI